MNSAAAGRSTQAKRRNVIPISTNSAAMTSSPDPGERKPRKQVGQTALSSSCQPHSLSDEPAPTARQTRHPAIPAMTYSTSHTGAKTQVGGVPGGAINDRYHVCRLAVTSVLLARPTSMPSPTKPIRARIRDHGVAEPGGAPKSGEFAFWKTRSFPSGGWFAAGVVGC